jgi:hypothetical protein
MISSWEQNTGTGDSVTLELVCRKGKDRRGTRRMYVYESQISLSEVNKLTSGLLLLPNNFSIFDFLVK